MVDKLKKRLKFWAIAGILILIACVGVSKVARVSNTVNGRELPIYSVETEEKKVAISFDAAWGDGYLRHEKWDSIMTKVKVLEKNYHVVYKEKRCFFIAL